MKTIKLKKDKTLSEKAIVIKILQSKGVGDVLSIKNHIRHQHHIKFDRTYCDKGAMEVYVFGAERKDVQQAVEGFERGLGKAGHGGYRISYDIEEREIDIEETIRQDERTKNKLEIDGLNKRIAELEHKWSKEKNGFESIIKELQEDKKKLQEKLANLKTTRLVIKEDGLPVKTKPKPGIISSFANWVFIKANPFQWKKEKPRREIKPTRKDDADNDDSEMWYDYVVRTLGDLEKLKDIGDVYCLYGGELNYIEKVERDSMVIVSPWGGSAIPINISMSGAEVMIARFSFGKHLKSKYKIDKFRTVTKLLEKLVKSKGLTKVKLMNPRNNKLQVFIGLRKD